MLDPGRWRLHRPCSPRHDSGRHLLSTIVPPVPRFDEAMHCSSSFTSCCNTVSTGLAAVTFAGFRNSDSCLSIATGVGHPGAVDVSDDALSFSAPTTSAFKGVVDPTGSGGLGLSTCDLHPISTATMSRDAFLRSQVEQIGSRSKRPGSGLILGDGRAGQSISVRLL